MVPHPYYESNITLARSDKKDEGKVKDLETKVDLLKDKLKTAFDPKIDTINFRWSLSEPDVG